MIQTISSIHILLHSFFICSWLLRKLSARTVTFDMTLNLEDQNLIPCGAVQICLFAFTGMFPCPLSLVNPLNAELNPICYLLALLGAYHFLHVSRIRVKSLTLRLLMSYIYGAPVLDVSRSHTTTQHSR